MSLISLTMPAVGFYEVLEGISNILHKYTRQDKTRQVALETTVGETGSIFKG
jgi:hypothetical protein